MKNIIGTMMVAMDPMVNVVLLTILLFFVFRSVG